MILRDGVNEVSSGIYSVIVDKDKPVVDIINPNTYYLDTRRPVVQATVSEQSKYLQLSVDDGRFRTKARNKDYLSTKTSLSEGVHTIFVKAIDCFRYTGVSTLGKKSRLSIQSNFILFEQLLK